MRLLTLCVTTCLVFLSCGGGSSSPTSPTTCGPESGCTVTCQILPTTFGPTLTKIVVSSHCTRACATNENLDIPFTFTITNGQAGFTWRAVNTPNQGTIVPGSGDATDGTFNAVIQLRPGVLGPSNRISAEANLIIANPAGASTHACGRGEGAPGVTVP